jgi:DNA modification methylase
MMKPTVNAVRTPCAAQRVDGRERSLPTGGREPWDSSQDGRAPANPLHVPVRVRRRRPTPPALGHPYYDDGQITIYLGDCRQVVPLLPEFDLLLADPPYGIGLAPKGRVGRGGTQFEPVQWDAAPPDAWVLQMLISRAKWQVLWGGNYYRGLDRSSCWLVWDKVNGTTCFADCELAWTNFRRAVRKFTWRWCGALQQDMKNKEKRVHPAQKPVPLLEWCMGWVPEARTVLDPYMGSGSTLVAACRRGVRAVGIDSHESYCAIAVERIKEERMKQPAAPSAQRMPIPRVARVPRTLA